MPTILQFKAGKKIEPEGELLSQSASFSMASLNRFNEDASIPQLLCFVLIVAVIIGLKLLLAQTPT